MAVMIGIDTGTNTGFAVAFSGCLKTVETLAIHQAMEKVRELAGEIRASGGRVRVEDARKRKWIPHGRGREVLQGVGSVKRDAGIWEDFLRDLGVPFELVAPQQNKTKLSAVQFRNITGWTGKTNEHGRDAAMLVFGLKG